MTLDSVPHECAMPFVDPSRRNLLKKALQASISFANNTHHRNTQLLMAKEETAVRIGVVGGSCTSGGLNEGFKPGDKIWIELVAKWFKDCRKVPKVEMFNGAIGGTTSRQK